VAPSNSSEKVKFFFQFLPSDKLVRVAEEAAYKAPLHPLGESKAKQSKPQPPPQPPFHADHCFGFEMTKPKLQIA